MTRGSYEAAYRARRFPWLTTDPTPELLQRMDAVDCVTPEDWQWWERRREQRSRDAAMKKQLKLARKTWEEMQTPRRTKQARFFGYTLRGTAADWTADELAAFGITDPSFRGVA